MRPSIEHGVVFSVVNNLRIICNMGVDINSWRARIGLFSQPRKSVLKLYELKPSFGRFRLIFRLWTCLIALLIVCGDIEENPGPGPYKKAQTTGVNPSYTAHRVHHLRPNQGRRHRGPPGPGSRQPEGMYM